MAEFSNLIITNKGQELLAKVIMGSGNVEFTKISTSSADYDEEQLQELTSLGSVQQTSEISKITRTNKTAIKVEAAFTNTELTAGYYMKALGLYAVDPDDGEILYAVTKETSGNCYMPAYNGVTVSGAYVQLITTVGNAENVSLEVDQAAVATIGDIQDLQKQIADLEAFIGYSDEDIFGVEVDFTNKKFTRLAGAVNRTAGAGFDSINAFGGRKRCNLSVSGRVLAYYGDPEFGADGNVNTTNSPFGHVMVEQPKFYYKVVPVIVEKNSKGSMIRKIRYYVSDTPKAGFKLHPAFVENGKENEKIYLAAFEGSLKIQNTCYANDEQLAEFPSNGAYNGHSLCSIANVKPMSGLTQNLTRANARFLANSTGTGWELSYAATLSASQLLMLIEYATFDMQTAIGNGNVSKTDDGSTNMAEQTGATVSLGNASGAVLNANGVQMVSYRGEENLWGNMWTWVDGINEKTPTNQWEEGAFAALYVADNTFQDETNQSPYKDTKIHPCYGEGYISAFGYSEEFDWLFIPTETEGNSALPVGDYYWNENTSWPWMVVHFGGSWGYGANAGAFCWNFHYTYTNSNRSIGARLVFIPSKRPEY